MHGCDLGHTESIYNPTTHNRISWLPAGTLSAFDRQQQEEEKKERNYDR